MFRNNFQVVTESSREPASAQGILGSTAYHPRIPPPPSRRSTISPSASLSPANPTSRIQVGIDGLPESRAKSVFPPSNSTDTSRLPPLAPVRRPSHSQSLVSHSAIPVNSALPQGRPQFLSQYSQESYRVPSAQTPQTHSPRTYGDIYVEPVRQSAPNAHSIFPAAGTPSQPSRSQSAVTSQSYPSAPARPTVHSAPTSQAQSIYGGTPPQSVRQSAPPPTPQAHSIHAETHQSFTPRSQPSLQQPYSNGSYGPMAPYFSGHNPIPQVVKPQTIRKVDSFIAYDPFRMFPGDNELDTPSDGLTFDDIDVPAAGSAPGQKIPEFMMDGHYDPLTTGSRFGGNFAPPNRMYEQSHRPTQPEVTYVPHTLHTPVSSPPVYLRDDTPTHRFEPSQSTLYPASGPYEPPLAAEIAAKAFESAVLHNSPAQSQHQLYEPPKKSTSLGQIVDSVINWRKQGFTTALRFVLVTIPLQMYLHLFLLRLPSLYFSRVTRIFVEADMTLPEIKKMALDTASQGLVDHFKIEMALESSGVHNRLTSTWEFFIESVMREWKTFNIISVLLLTAILTILQIQSAAEDPLTRYTALFSLMCALISLLYGCIYIIRFGSMRKAYKAAEWALESQKTKTLVCWNAWVMLAMPAIWLTWSIILYIVCIMSFVWRSGVTNATPPGISNKGLLAIRIGITVLLALGVLYAFLIISTFRRYGEEMDRAWKRRVNGWVTGKATGSLGSYGQPVMGTWHPTARYDHLNNSMEDPSSAYRPPFTNDWDMYPPVHPSDTYVPPPEPHLTPTASLHSTDVVTQANTVTNQLSMPQHEMMPTIYIPPSSDEGNLSGFSSGSEDRVGGNDDVVPDNENRVHFRSPLISDQGSILVDTSSSQGLEENPAPRGSPTPTTASGDLPTGGTYQTQDKSRGSVSDALFLPVSRHPTNPTTVTFDQNSSYTLFTNHSPHRVIWNGLQYPTALHLHEALKFLDHRPELAEQIRQCANIHEVYPLSAKYLEFQRPDWEDQILPLMEEVLYAKFRQHPDLRILLLSTGTADLEYVSTVDEYWGSGADRQGANQLGKVLTQVRERLREESTWP